MTTTKYVDGFVIPLQKDKIELYRTMAEKACRIWKEHGALEFRECVGDDLEVKDQASFSHLAGTKPDETVIFSWIGFESRESRDQVNAKSGRHLPRSFRGRNSCRFYTIPTRQQKL
jgi:uncharacterized protein YbaA (DUF1428 family)